MTGARFSWVSMCILGSALLACGDDETIPAAATTVATSGQGGSSTATTAQNGAGGGGAAPPVCERAGLPPGVHDFTTMFEGRRRVYELAVPLSYDGSAAIPLVFDFHGYTSNKDQQEQVSGIAALGETEGFAVVRPNGIGSSWNAGDFCCGQAQSEGLDDVGLMRAIVAEVSAAMCIDPARVYATGLSNGGALSHRIACEAADVFAAVAPVSYPLDFDPFDKCQPSRPIAVMHSHGAGDVIVPYDGSFYQPSTPESFAYWGQVNGCSGMPVETYAKDDSVCQTYEQCGGGVEVTLCTIDGGHILYNNNDAVPVADLIWGFLSRFTLP
ncbi:MAG TPA: PHB depolymerase family esterase [Polyangiaceae bacterium]|jgi:polyhydroxybutyrate depolymerase|nr:PHB depolymerase family esterase [Polyangiaceae bacterium]